MHTGKREREINSGEEDGSEDVPAEHADDEGEGATSENAGCRCGCVPGCSEPVGSGETAEGWDE